jgi:hypothetical protein
VTESRVGGKGTFRDLTSCAHRGMNAEAKKRRRSSAPWKGRTKANGESKNEATPKGKKQREDDPAQKGADDRL